MIETNYTNFDFLFKRAIKLTDKIIGYRDEELAKDMAMAGIEWVLSHDDKTTIYYQDVRTAMIAELFSWWTGFNLKGHRKKPDRITIQYDDWVSQYSRTISDYLDRSVMSRQCLRRILSGNLSKGAKKNRIEDVRLIFNTEIDRASSTKSISDTKEMIKSLIDEYCWEPHSIINKKSKGNSGGPS